MLEVYGPEQTHWLSVIRSISLVNDGGRWSFDQSGTPFLFEDLDRYAAKRVRDRFTFELLERHLHELGLSPFELDFYLPDGGGPAMLVELQGRLP